MFSCGRCDEFGLPRETVACEGILGRFLGRSVWYLQHFVKNSAKHLVGGGGRAYNRVSKLSQTTFPREMQVTRT